MAIVVVVWFVEVPERECDGGVSSTIRKRLTKRLLRHHAFLRALHARTGRAL